MQPTIMSNIIKVGSMFIKLDYYFDDYFNGNIEKYFVDTSEFHHHIKTVVADTIDFPKGDIVVSLRNRYIIKDDLFEYLVVTDASNQVNVLIQYDTNYKEIIITLQKDIEHIEEKEYIFSGILFMDLALHNGYLSIHAAGIQYQNKGILFSAPSQTGKSTHARYWLKQYPDTTIFNDDKPLIHIEKTIQTIGSPWSGKTTVNENIELDLSCIVFLSQGETNTISEIPYKEKLPYLMRNINRPRQKELWEQNLTILQSLIQHTKMYTATVTNHIDSVDVIKNTIIGE